MFHTACNNSPSVDSGRQYVDRTRWRRFENVEHFHDLMAPTSIARWSKTQRTASSGSRKKTDGSTPSALAKLSASVMLMTAEPFIFAETV